MTDRAAPGGRAHLLALLLAAAIVAAWAGALAAALGTAGTREGRSGELLVVFPRGLGEAEILTRVANAGGVVMRGTWLANVWQAHGEGEGFAGALRAQGALLALPPLPFESFAVGGCSFGATTPLAKPRPPARPG